MSTFGRPKSPFEAPASLLRLVISTVSELHERELAHTEVRKLLAHNGASTPEPHNRDVKALENALRPRSKGAHLAIKGTRDLGHLRARRGRRGSSGARRRKQLGSLSQPRGSERARRHGSQQVRCDCAQALERRERRRGAPRRGHP